MDGTSFKINRPFQHPRRLEPFRPNPSSLLKLQILLFAGLGEHVGSNSAQIDVDLPSTASDVLATLQRSFPDAAPLISFSRLAIDQEYVEMDYQLDGTESEIALIPPVSGG